jgi:hypothetical protein
MKKLSTRFLLFVIIVTLSQKQATARNTYAAAARDTGTITKQAPIKQLELWRKQIRAALFIPAKAPSIASKNFGSFSPMPGVVANRVTYGTQFGMRIPAIVYTPEKVNGRLPAVIIVGLLYAKAGAVVITYDPVGENERSGTHLSEAREHDNVIPGAESPARMGGLMIEDVIQSVSYALSRPDVDAKRVAVLGYSMGSFHAALAAAIDPRINALVLSGGGDLDGNGGAWDSSTKTMCQGGPYQALSFLPDKGAILYALHQRSGETLILNGMEDGMVTKPNHMEHFFAGLHNRVAIITGGKAPVIEYKFYPGVAHRPSWVNADAAIWLNNRLRFPNLKSIAPLETNVTHIAEWAIATGAHINKGYAGEAREGGIRAVGTGFPAPTHDQLQVVPMAEWEAHRDQYIWEACARHIRKAQGL